MVIKMPSVELRRIATRQGFTTPVNVASSLGQDIDDNDRQAISKMLYFVFMTFPIQYTAYGWTDSNPSVVIFGIGGNLA